MVNIETKQYETEASVEAQLPLFCGEGKFNGVPGYIFIVSVDVFNYYYSITIYTLNGDDGIVFEETDILSGGNIQIHPPNEGHPAVPPL